MKIDDTYCDTPKGTLYIRRWQPATAQTAAPILMLHDSLGSVDLWRSFPQELCAATGRPVIAYDRLGFGRSDARQGPLPTHFVAQEGQSDFAHVLQAMHVKNFVVLGHSVGGGMAVNIAAQYGKRCVALITESAQAFVEDRTVQGIEQARILFEQPGQLERLEKYHGAKARWVLDAWITTWLSPEFSSWSLRPVLPQVTCPVLAIHGANDEYGSARHPELIADSTGGPARTCLVPDAQHVPHREKEAYVVQIIADFLKEMS